MQPSRSVDVAALRRVANAWCELGWLPEHERPIGWRLLGRGAAAVGAVELDRLPDALNIPGLRHFYFCWSTAVTADTADGRSAANSLPPTPDLPGWTTLPPWATEHTAADQVALLDHLVTDDPAAAQLAHQLAVPVWWLGNAAPQGCTVERLFTVTEPSPTLADWAAQIGPVAAMYAVAHPVHRGLDLLGEEQAAVQTCFQAFQQGDAAHATDSARRLLVVHPHRSDLWHLLGVLAQQAGHLDLAVAYFTIVTQRTPGFPKGWQGLALAEWARGRLAEALAAVQHAVSAAPADASLRALHARLLQHSGHSDLAATEASNALALRPDDPGALQERADALARLGQFSEAIGLYRQALQQRPGALDLHFNLGVVLSRSGQADESLPHFEQVIASSPPHAALYARSLAELAQAHADCAAWIPAVAAARRAHGAQPDDEAGLRRLVRLERLVQHPERALAALDLRAAAAPLPADLRIEHALLQRELARWPAAASPATDAPELPSIDADLTALQTDLASQPAAPLPPAQDLRWLAEARPSFSPKATTLLERLWQRQATDAASVEGRNTDQPRHQAPRQPRQRLRIAYAFAERADGRDAAWTQALVGEHDPARFEAWAVSWGRADGHILSPVEQADEAQLRLIDLTGQPDRLAARQLADMDFDLLFDLEGCGPQQRSGILARRVAPCQVGWLERQGHTLPPWIDAVITPKSPGASPAAATEREPGGPHVVTTAHPPLRLHGRMQAPSKGLADSPNRRAAGLPERAPVLACWAPCRWIEPALFSIWMRLLQACPPAVLWLSDHPGVARVALQSEAEQAGVAAARLIFASPAACASRLRLNTLALADLHLAPGRIADPHSLGDALAAGVPSLAFAHDQRLLHAAGLDPTQFLANDLDDYERIAQQHLRHPRDLIALRRRFAQRATTAPLFDLHRQVQQLEALIEELAAQPRRADLERAT